MGRPSLPSGPGASIGGARELGDCQAEMRRRPEQGRVLVREPAGVRRCGLEIVGFGAEPGTERVVVARELLERPRVVVMLEAPVLRIARPLEAATVDDAHEGIEEAPLGL